MKLFLLLLFSTLYFSLQSQVGRVGINTETPLALLHVKDSSVLFTGPTMISPPYTAPPVEGAGARMMWYPSKGAFRAGSVDGSAWNKDSIGVQSVAFGFNAKALKTYSIAMGQSTIARGDNSISIGRFSNAEGFGSVAIGVESQSIGPGCVSMATSAAIGFSSVAIGPGNTAFGDYSISLGNSNNVYGESGCSLGAFGTSYGISSLTSGSFTTAEGDFSAAFGEGTTAGSSHSFVVGRYNLYPIGYDPVSWVENEELFVIGNGELIAPSNAMTVLKNGNVSIGGQTPTSTLEVEGTFKLGTAGNQFSALLHHTETIDLSSIAANTSYRFDINVTGATPGGTVQVSPSAELPDGLIISYARIRATNIVEIKIWNATGASIDPVSMDFMLTLAQ